MPYSPEHKNETRERILQTARRLFSRRGFSEVTIDEIMTAAGLTRGGFYNHFQTKEELYAEAITQFLRNDPPEAWRTLNFSPSAHGTALARMIVNAYLSREHFDDRDGSCPMVGLPSDVARGGKVVRVAFRKVVDMMVDVFSANLAPGGKPTRERALALVALCIGGMVLARAVDDDRFSDELREAARQQVLASSGWDTPSD
jgi:TetR/AcrR family transcriptional regulator, transcriptional repressor for nem operon